MNKPDGLLPIGVVAKSFGVNESRIRRMESAGMLTPAYISENSNYRYYDRENISQIANILALKSFGFINEDIRDYLASPGNYTELYDKLVAKQAALALQIEKLSKRIKNSSLSQGLVTEFQEGYAYAKQAHMVPNLEAVSTFSKELLFDGIRKKYPVDYTKAIFILTDCMDYRTYQLFTEQDLTFCLPLRCKVEGDEIRHIPAIQTVALIWNDPTEGYQPMIPVIDDILHINNIEQSGALCASYDVGGYQGDNISPNDTVMHILVPFREKDR